MEQKIRVLVAKPGLDGHDRGAKVLARAFMDAGMEVIYTGIRRTPEQIAEVAVQEDVDVVALSCLSGAQTLFPKVVDLLKRRGQRILVLGGESSRKTTSHSSRSTGSSRSLDPGLLLQHAWTTFGAT